MSKRAVILAGGRGTRLRPYTVVLPKPLMPIGEYPILEVVVRQLAHFGFTHLTMAVNHQAELIKAFFSDGQKWGVTIDYSLEDEPLGTMGPLRNIADLPDHFLVTNGDILTDLDFATLYEQHVQAQSLFTISSKKRVQKVNYGVLETTAEGFLSGFREKPILDCEVSMGVYIVSKEAVAHIPKNHPYGFDNLMLDLLQKNKPVRVRQFDGYWLDIGRPDDYMQAIEEFDAMRALFRIDEKREAPSPAVRRATA